MMFSALALLLLQQKPVDIVEPAALSLELTRFASGEAFTASAFWCPAEFVHVSLLQRGGISASEAAKSAESFRSVNLFAIAASETKQGVPAPLDAASLAHRVVLRTGSGKEILPLAGESVPPELRAFAASLRPGLASAMGPAGKNMALVFFPGTDAEGKRLLLPHTRTNFSLVLRELPSPNQSVSFSWKLPLPSLLEEKSCPRCSEKCRGDWSYCPFDGAKL